MYDLIILGVGPAGMSAAIYAARRKVNFCIIGNLVGGQMSWTSEVANYPGYSVLNGPDLTAKFKAHMDEYGAEFKQENIEHVERRDASIFVKTNVGEYEAKSVVIATGKTPKKLGVKGEEEFKAKGVSYCATCDAPLFKGKRVVVVGGGSSGLEAALHLVEYASEVHLFEVGDELKGEPYLRDKVLGDSRIKVSLSSKIVEIYGEGTVKGINYEENGEAKNLEVEGVFVEVGLITEAGFVEVDKNEWGEIKIFRSKNGRFECLTSVEGVFAAGDCTDTPSKQIVVAAGEGCKAALASFDYVLRSGKQ